MKIDNQESNSVLSFEDYKKQILEDYKVVFTSRQTSILGRREVLSGKGTFGIFGDGKELPQIVLNRFFQPGDFRSGYYRDQTLMFAQGHLNPGENLMKDGRMGFLNKLSLGNSDWYRSSPSLGVFT
ncbi:MAG: hypothetical protein ACPH4K_08115, partial [Flavobacteriaceae bacterium]